MPDLGPAERFINDMLSVERDFIKDALRLYRILRLDLVDLISAIGLGADLEGRIRQRLEQFRQAIQNLVLEYLQRLEGAGDRMAQRSLNILREVESRIPDFTALQFTTAADRQNALGQLVLHIADFVGVLESRFNSTIAELRQGGENETAALRRLTATSLVDGQASVYRHGANELRTEAQRNLWATGAALLALYYAEVQRRGVRLQKQAVATIDKRTTKTCLRVHGQIKNVGQPFELTAKPRFARKQQHPPFHWNCRTVEAPYLPVLEQSGLTTGQMRDRARAELDARNRPTRPRLPTAGPQISPADRIRNDILKLNKTTQGRLDKLNKERDRLILERDKLLAQPLTSETKKQVMLKNIEIIKHDGAIRQINDGLNSKIRTVLKVDDPAGFNFDTDVKGKPLQAAQKGLDDFNNLVSRQVLPEGGSIKLRKTPDNRGTFDPDTGSIFITDSTSPRSMAHELGHWLEDRNPSIRRRANDFLEQRTRGERSVSLRDLTGLNYDPSERTKKDRFIDPYMGKKYDTGHTEIISTGVEMLYTEPVRFARDDPEYFDFIYNILRGR